jgi:tetratricopeptide (TPR) repeat protein
MRELLGSIVRIDQGDVDTKEAEELIKPVKPTKGPSEEPAAPEEFASEFADYHRGALSFRCGQLDKAVERWKALLARPETERRYRTTWAHFMSGKAAIEAEKWDEAIACFVKTREVVAAGFVDTLGLGAASLGWQAFACEESGRFADAARLYLEQLASGDTTAILSLRYLMERAFGENASFDELVRDPVMQRIGTAGAVSDMAVFSGMVAGDDSTNRATRWLTALEKAQIKEVRDADRVAWIAYSQGQFDKARRWLERAQSEAPYSLWLKAKLAMREGKLDTAAKLLSRAIEKLPPTEPLVSRPLISITEIPPRITASGDLGLLHLGRGEFVTAFRTFLDAGHFSDAWYVADAVLTIDELKRFVDEELSAWTKARVLKKPAPSADQPGERPEAEEVLQIGWEELSEGPGPELRRILARRYHSSRPSF